MTMGTNVNIGEGAMRTLHQVDIDPSVFALDLLGHSGALSAGSRMGA